MKNLIIMVLISHNMFAQYDFGYGKPLESDKSYYIKLSGVSDFNEILRGSTGVIFVYKNDVLKCKTLNLTYSKLTHKKREISQKEYNSLTSTSRSTIINLETVFNKFKDKKTECYAAQEYLQNRYCFLWIKEGDKYHEYEVYPTIAGAVVED